LYKELSNFGFGFIEIGTLHQRTGRKPKKRLFRLKEDSAINRMGFNNGGVLAVERLKEIPGF
jgi:dihydroorotate dehydrogenase